MMMCVFVISNDCDVYGYLVSNYLWFVKHYKVQ